MDEEPAPPKRSTRASGGGKQLRGAAVRGKQLRKTEPESDEMEESEEDDDDESSEEEMEMDTDDPQKLVKGEEDQKMLDALPELEREAILAERFEKMKNEADMKRALRESKRKEREGRKAAKKGKAGSKKKPRKGKAGSKTDTSKDADIAAALGTSRESGGRNRDVAGVKSKKAAALADLRVSLNANLLRRVCFRYFVIC
jgi:RNA polymerase-associated protein RTF1